MKHVDGERKHFAVA